MSVNWMNVLLVSPFHFARASSNTWIPSTSAVTSLLRRTNTILLPLILEQNFQQVWSQKTEARKIHRKETLKWENCALSLEECSRYFRGETMKTYMDVSFGIIAACGGLAYMTKQIMSPFYPFQCTTAEFLVSGVNILKTWITCSSPWLMFLATLVSLELTRAEPSDFASPSSWSWKHLLGTIPDGYRERKKLELPIDGSWEDNTWYNHGKHTTIPLAWIFENTPETHKCVDEMRVIVAERRRSCVLWNISSSPTSKKYYAEAVIPNRLVCATTYGRYEVSTSDRESVKPGYNYWFADVFMLYSTSMYPVGSMRTIDIA